MVFLNGNMPEPNGVFRWDTTFFTLILVILYNNGDSLFSLFFFDIWTPYFFFAKKRFPLFLYETGVIGGILPFPPTRIRSESNDPGGTPPRSESSPLVGIYNHWLVVGTLV